ncbi:MAG: TIGR03088 family PEP-CTERM/XrtA system glycosyltransferase [Thiobacillaceae bacterium]
MSQPLIVHLVHGFDTGGMENGMVNLFNQLPPERYRHAVVTLTGYTEFRNRITAQPVEFYALGKKPGHDPAVFVRLYALLRRLKPAILHTRNLAALEGQFIGCFAGIKGRIHGEHGRDTFDLHGRNWKYNLLRKAARPLVDQYIAVSEDLARWLVNTVCVRPEKVNQIYNGVDSVQFCPRGASRSSILPPDFTDDTSVVFGSVGRMAEVKDYPTLVMAFVLLVQRSPEARHRARLVLVGEGMARSQCQMLLDAAGLTELAWLPGERHDIAECMRAIDVFVLPSLNEGISNTILEAQSSGLPVIATRVGGNLELIEDGITGTLVEPANPEAMAQVLRLYLDDGIRREREGRAARQGIEVSHSLGAMAAAYQAVYDKVLAARG